MKEVAACLHKSKEIFRPHSWVCSRQIRYSCTNMLKLIHTGMYVFMFTGTCILYVVVLVWLVLLLKFNLPGWHIGQETAKT